MMNDCKASYVSNEIERIGLFQTHNLHRGGSHHGGDGTERRSRKERARQGGSKAAAPASPVEGCCNRSEDPLVNPIHREFLACAMASGATLAQDRGIGQRMGGGRHVVMATLASSRDRRRGLGEAARAGNLGLGSDVLHQVGAGQVAGSACRADRPGTGRTGNWWSPGRTGWPDSRRGECCGSAPAMFTLWPEVPSVRADCGR